MAAPTSPLWAQFNRWITEPFVYGESDCCLSVADWVKHVTGVDVAADLRLTYTDLTSCQRETNWRRDPLGVTTWCMEEVGSFERTAEPVAGDVGVLRALVGGRPVPFAGICLGEGHGWAAKAERGAVQIRGKDLVEVLRAWRIGYDG